ncbi:MAG: DUF932 domain-containing protein [Deltaproteobacteria bacterium]|jgi:phage/plasmid-like protein (TIGR03299 family)|nr:DUF932 domain-containing protein [Deltaproteobacteria bacterium]
MAHEIEVVDGRASMVFAGETPWHGLGERLSGDETADEIRRKAGLDWTVEVEPLYRKVGESFELYKLARASVRDLDGADLGCVGPRWTPYQNESMFECFRPMVESGLMKWHTAGSLRSGQRVWCLCELNLENSEILPGDEIRKFAMLSNGHDGKLAVHFGFTPIRVVCANTEAFARNSKASKLIRVRHSRLVDENVEKLRDIMNLANQEFEATCDQYRFLAGRAICKADLEKYVKVIFDLQTKKEDEISTRQKNINSRIVELFETGRGSEVAGSTWWGAYNAVTEYANWEKGRNAENRMDSVWFGQNQALLTKALDSALALSA